MEAAICILKVKALTFEILQLFNTLLLDKSLYMSRSIEHYDYALQKKENTSNSSILFPKKNTHCSISQWFGLMRTSW